MVRTLSTTVLALHKSSIVESPVDFDGSGWRWLTGATRDAFVLDIDRLALSTMVNSDSRLA
jgi:hypothetical protein